MLNTLTNINCEMKSMAIYSKSIALSNHSTASDKSLFVTSIWEFENQLNAPHIGSDDIMYDSR